MKQIKLEWRKNKLVHADTGLPLTDDEQHIYYYHDALVGHLYERSSHAFFFEEALMHHATGTLDELVDAVFPEKLKPIPQRGTKPPTAAEKAKKRWAGTRSCSIKLTGPGVTPIDGPGDAPTPSK